MTWGKQNSEAEAHEQLSYAFDNGINFMDTVRGQAQAASHTPVEPLPTAAPVRPPAGVPYGKGACRLSSVLCVLWGTVHAGNVTSGSCLRRRRRRCTRCRWRRRRRARRTNTSARG